MKKFTSANHGNGNNASKVNFFQHFPRPYGLATTEASVTPEDFSNNLKSYSCEWLCRPGIAFSEFAETMRANWTRKQEQRKSLAPDKPSQEAMSSKKMKKSMKT